MYRAAYDRMPEKYARRTFFCATVNQENFLGDHTGTTRYGVIKSDYCDYKHNVDMRQLWAEVRSWYVAGEQWWLTPEEETFMEQSNVQFQEVDPLEDGIYKHFDFRSGERVLLTCTEVMQAIGYEKPTKADTNRVSMILSKMGCAQVRTNAKKGYKVPIPKTQQEIYAERDGTESL
jgi:putative DNA primase/helicase